MLCDDLGEMQGVEGGSRGRDTYIYIILTVLHCTAETNIVKQIFSS